MCDFLDKASLQCYTSAEPKLTTGLEAITEGPSSSTSLESIIKIDGAQLPHKKGEETCEQHFLDKKRAVDVSDTGLTFRLENIAKGINDLGRIIVCEVPMGWNRISNVGLIDDKEESVWTIKETVISWSKVNDKSNGGCYYTDIDISDKSLYEEGDGSGDSSTILLNAKTVKGKGKILKIMAIIWTKS